MATRQYVGARYVPKFANPIEWSSNNIYEPLTMVTYLNNTYTSKKPVPQGVEITDSEYWVLTGNYNAQVEQYRQEVNGIASDLQVVTETANSANETANSANETANSVNEKVDTVQSNVNTLESNVEALSENVEDNTKDLSELNILNKAQYAVTPQIIGTDVYPITSTMTAGGNVQLSCVCSDGTYIYGFYPHNDPTNLVGVRRYHLTNNTIEKNFPTFVGGHANSACWLPTGKILVVQLQLYGEGQSAVQNGNIVVLNGTTLQQERIVTLPFNLQSVTYDHVRNKLYVWSANTINSIYEVNPETFETTYVGTIMGLGTHRTQLQDCAIHDGVLCLTSYDGLVGWCELNTEMYPFKTPRHYTPTDSDGRRWLGETSGLEYMPDGRLIQTFYTTITPAVLGTFTYVTDTTNDIMTFGHPNATGRALNLNIPLNENKFYIGPSQIRSLAEHYAYAVGSYSTINVNASGEDMCLRAIPLRDGYQLILNSNVSYTLPNLQVSGYTKVLVSQNSTLTFNGTININAIDLESFGGDLMIGGYGTINNECSGCLAKLGQRGTLRTAQLNGTNLTISDTKNKLSSYQMWQTDYRYINFTTI